MVFVTQADGTPARFVGGSTDVLAELGAGKLVSPGPLASSGAAATAATAAWAQQLAGSKALRGGLRADTEGWLSSVSGAGPPSAL